MLYRYPVKEVKSGALKKRYGYAVVVMQFYPRFLTKDLIDEYLRSLAPERTLFADFKKLDRELKNHDQAFADVHYEQRFSLSAQGREDLMRLSVLAAERDVYLLCQCKVTERCHADLLLMAARHLHGAGTQTLRHRYPIFEERLVQGKWETPIGG